jgi:SAM-dependent methyltransferase
METVKGNLKDILLATHLYNSARQIKNWNPDIRRRFRNIGYRIAGAEDGLPIPPAHLIYLVILSRDIAWFLKSGYISYRCIASALNKNGYDTGDFQNILDFGCGCGRVLRHWKKSSRQDLYGTDYNEQLILWSQKNLSALAEFKTNQSHPPLNYPDDKFNFIYSLSVFTHLSDSMQKEWMNELFRILKPNGLLYMTLHGASRLYQLNELERQKFQDGELVIKLEGQSGNNDCAAFHPAQYVRNVLANQFEVVDFIVSGQVDMDQDAYLLRKPA